MMRRVEPPSSVVSTRYPGHAWLDTPMGEGGVWWSEATSGHEPGPDFDPDILILDDSLSNVAKTGKHLIFGKS